jgi:hypothetical protein
VVPIALGTFENVIATISASTITDATRVELTVLS